MAVRYFRHRTGFGNTSDLANGYRLQIVRAGLLPRPAGDESVVCDWDVRDIPNAVERALSYADSWLELSEAEAIKVLSNYLGSRGAALHALGFDILAQELEERFGEPTMAVGSQ